MDRKGRPEGADMHGNNFFHGPSVAPGKGPRHRHALSAEEGENMAIAGLEIGGAEIQGRIGVIPQGIGAGLEEQEIGGRRLDEPRKVLFEHLEQVGSIAFGG
jgi:hypothetical protein